jgi:plasmid stabilization system protein ParE
MCINWLLSALTDIETILNDSAARDTLEARNVAARVAVTEQNILAFPKAAYYNAEYDYYERYVPRTRVILVYRLTAKQIIIVAAFHTSQSPHKKPH